MADLERGVSTTNTVVDHQQPELPLNGNAPRHTYTQGSDVSKIRRAVTPGGHPLDTSQPAFPVYHRRIANPAPLGLLAFATTTFCLSWYNVGIRNIANPNVIVGLALAYGGTAQFIAGVFEFVCGNTFGATAFCSYGAFWWSFALIYWPSSGILTAEYAEGELASALGIYLICWFIFTFMMFFGTLKSSIGLALVFFWLTFTFMMLAIGEFTGSAACHTAGGALGIITAFCAFYTGISGILTPDTSYFTLPVGDLSKPSRLSKKAE